MFGISAKAMKTTKMKYRVGRWTPSEHVQFLKDLAAHGIQWSNFNIPTRTRVQIRTHAQKFFLKTPYDVARVAGLLLNLNT